MKGKKISYKEFYRKLKDCSEFRVRIFKELCQHVALGYSVDCFEHLSKNEIACFIKDFPDEFDLSTLDKALRKGKIYWEGIGRAQSEGSCLGNSRSWYYNMANRYGWREKLEVEAEHKGQVSVNIVSYASPTPLQDAENHTSP